MKTRTLARFLTVSATVLAVLGQVGLVAQAAPHTKIGASRANAIVLKRYPGHLTAKTTLENEEGKWQYGVMVRSSKTLREVMVDAYTGKIANIEVTTASKERVEKQQDAADARKQQTSREASRKAKEKGEAKD